ncbi:hypothetical protein CK203_106450 [Vitis vinifera]|uniref:Uncharacterized protein n=1 Tax=Vitis vinifera TaxID=29760 RepID=A0A438CAJ8_VITVI|nr:hypothetical protein CK203_106450 [Vitis vinifera]
MDRRKKQRPRNPLKDLNHVATTISSTNSSSSSSQSIEVPRGCLRFLLSNSSSSKSPRYRPKALSKTPKSAPNARISKPSKSKPRKENIPKRAVGDELHKLRKTHLASTSGSQEKGCLVRGVDEASEAIQASLRGVADENSTPVSKLPSGSSLDFAFDKAVEENSNGSINKTPPVQPSVSPEIQCGSSLMAITPACYGAGHVLSGFRVSVVPLPTEASMHWLLSPQGKKDENLKEGSENPCGRLALSPSPLSDMCNFSDKTTNTITSGSSIDKRSRKSLLSPTGLHEFQRFPGSLSDYMVGCSSLSPLHVTPCCKAQEEMKYRYSLVEESTPISMRTDSLGSGNVIQTPQSDSSSDRHAGSSLLNADVCKDRQFESELDSLAEVLQMTSFSPKSHISMWDPSGLSSQFDQLPTPYNSIDLSRLQKTCLSDEEEDANGCSDDQLKSHLSPGLNVDVGNDQILTADFGSSKFLDCKPGADRKGKEKLLPQRPIACAESVSTDGGGLVASGDSDWTLCYKNHLFEE